MSGTAKIIRAWACATTAALLAGSAHAQGIDYSRFQRSTLDALNANLAASVAKDKARVPKIGDKIYDKALSPWVVQVNYDGAVRPMSAEEATVVHYSFNTVQQEPLADLYQQSMLFRVNGKDYWLPVQSGMLPYFAKELKKGQAINLYVLLVGGLLQKDGWQWLLPVVDFQKIQDSPAKATP